MNPDIINIYFLDYLENIPEVKVQQQNQPGYSKFYIPLYNAFSLIKIWEEGGGEYL